MAGYKRGEAREWAREKLVGVVNCTIPSFTGDLKRINEKAIRHDTRLAISHGFMGTLGVSEVSITLPEYLDFLRIIADETAGRDGKRRVVDRGLCAETARQPIHHQHAKLQHVALPIAIAGILQLCDSVAGAREPSTRPSVIQPS